MNTQLKGMLWTLIGVVFVIPDSLFVRLISSDALVTAFWRSLTSGVIIGIGLLIFSGPRVFSNIWRMGAFGWMYCFLIGSTSPAFVFAVQHTSVANVVFIFAAMPVFSAIMSYFLLNEVLSKKVATTIVFVFIGLTVIAYGSSRSNVSNWRGDLWALYVAVAYAFALTIVRRLKHISMLPAIPIGYIGSAIALGSVINPMAQFDQNAQLYVLHGLFIAIATCGLTLGPRYITSPEVALIILLESVLAPVLVWFVLAEYPGPYAIIGGAIVVIALIVLNLRSLIGTHRSK
jgi:drug/metabolite transporter (DMT)-like permease